MGLVPTDGDFQNLEMILKLGRYFYKIFGSCIDIGTELFRFSNQFEKLFFGIIVMIRKIKSLKQVKAGFAQGAVKFGQAANSGKSDDMRIFNV